MTDAQVPRVLILLHSAKDVRVTAELVASERAAAVTCMSVEEIGREIRQGADALIVSEEVLEEDSGAYLQRALAAQPEWSSLPVLLMVADGHTSPLATAIQEWPASVQILNYPVALATFKSAIRSALGGRRRQYQVRDLLVDLAERGEALRDREGKYRTLSAENERLYRQQLDIAETLQFALVNVPSEIGSLRIGHLYRSATEAARVGGDFYDAFMMKRGKIAVLIGDVAGHGIEAARTATLVNDVIHAFGHQTHRSELILRHTNSLLIEKNLDGFVTLFLGILDPETGLLRYSTAGHPESMLRRASGEILMLGSGSLPLGVFPDASWKPREVKLEVDDLLLLYTDGVIEARRDGEFFGEERLVSLLRRKRVPPESLPALIIEKVLAHSGGNLQDDVAVLTLLLLAKGNWNAPASHST